MKNYIREARQAKGITQTELANQIGTIQNQVYKLESGESDFKVSTLLKISRALGVSIAYLLGVEEGALSSEERAVLECYNALEDDTRRAVLQIVQQLPRGQR